jgi:hypothetical protein
MKKIKYIVIAWDRMTNDVYRIEYKSLFLATMKANSYRRIYNADDVVIIDKLTGKAIEGL